MTLKQEINLDYIRNQGLIIFEAISGSHAYGTNIETSDEDIRGVFVLGEDDLLGLNYVEQVSDPNNDIVFYELRRFLELIAVNNPNILELLNTPDDCIVYKHPAFDLILENKDKFITKVCKDSFAGYAKTQINKAKGMNKMQNWEEKKVERKTPMDFCYVTEEEKAIPLRKVLEESNLEQKFCGLVKIPHARDMYSLFYDTVASDIFSSSTNKSTAEFMKQRRIDAGLPVGLGYAGIEVEKSNKIRLSSIPKGEKSLFNIYYNEDGYAQHCKDYKRYKEWLDKRNTTRWTDVKEHGQAIDGKNMLHCRRLLDMAKEIAEGKGINVRRPNAKELLDIRKGKVKLQDLIDHANEEIAQIDQLFTNSSLPDKIDYEMIHNLLVKTRKMVYKEKYDRTKS